MPPSDTARPATAETVNGPQTRAVAGADEQRLTPAPASPQGRILPRVIEARLRDQEARDRLRGWVCDAGGKTAIADALRAAVYGARRRRQ